MKKTVKHQQTKRVRSLSDRMKKGELYVVFCGIDEDYSLRFIGYGDPAGTPRIYSKETLDPRVWDQLLICKSVESANKRLGPDNFAVVLPLSAMLEYGTDFEVRRWAAPQRSISPTEVHEYVSTWVRKNSNGNKRDPVADREFCEKQVVMDHGRWIASHPTGTLADLRDYLEGVRFEMLRYEDTELIADHIDDLDDAADYLSGWGDPTEPDDEDDPPTFEYRLANVDEDLGHLDELIELAGASFKVADLPSRDDPSSSLKLAG